VDLRSKPVKCLAVALAAIVLFGAALLLLLPASPHISFIKWQNTKKGPVAVFRLVNPQRTKFYYFGYGVAQPVLSYRLRAVGGKLEAFCDHNIVNIGSVPGMVPLDPQSSIDFCVKIRNVRNLSGKHIPPSALSQVGIEVQRTPKQFYQRSGPISTVKLWLERLRCPVGQDVYIGYGSSSYSRSLTWSGVLTSSPPARMASK
jgi:hypothetical protein